MLYHRLPHDAPLPFLDEHPVIKLAHLPFLSLTAMTAVIYYLDLPPEVCILHACDDAAEHVLVYQYHGRNWCSIYPTQHLVLQNHTEIVIFILSLNVR